MAFAALAGSTTLDCTVMIACPLLPNRVHAMRAAIDRIRLCVVAADAIRNGADMALNLEAPQVVIFVG